MSLLLALLLALVSETRELKTEKGLVVPSPESRWTATISGGVSGVAFVALAWGWTGGWFGWLALIVTGLPAFAVAFNDIAHAPAPQQRSKTATA